MAFRFFSIPIQGCPNTERDLNAFLRSHSVVSIERRFVDQGAASVWSLCIDYLESATAQSGGINRGGAQRGRIDYREILTPQQFAIFSRLREARKQIAQAEGTPVYTVFTNEHLAQMVQQNAQTKADLQKIVGVGDSRVEKYGERVVLALNEERGVANEAPGKPR